MLQQMLEARKDAQLPAVEQSLVLQACCLCFSMQTLLEGDQLDLIMSSVNAELSIHSVNELRQL